MAGGVHVRRVPLDERLVIHLRGAGEKDVEPVVCRFATEAIPDCGEVHFVVRPVSEWGKFGEPLATDWTPVAHALRS